MKYLIALCLFMTFNAQAFWDSELSDDVDLFIYQETTLFCENTQMIKEIYVYNIESRPSGEIYFVEFESESHVDGEIVVSKNYWGELQLSSLTCPQL